MSLAWVDLADYLPLAGAALGIDPAVLVRYTNLPLAESALAAPAASFSGTEFYPQFHLKVAVGPAVLPLIERDLELLLALDQLLEGALANLQGPPPVRAA